MKWFVTCILFLALPITAAAQGLLNSPESVVFDSARNRYLVCNAGDGTIVEIDSNGVESYFYISDPVYLFAGSCIVGDTLFASGISEDFTESILHGFDLSTGELVIQLPLPATTGRVIDGLASDGSTFLYAVDTGGRIFKVRISNLSYSVFASTGLSSGLQACVYDGDNDRLLAVEYVPNAPVKEVSLEEGYVTAVAGTEFGNYDGIAIDDEGFIYLAVTGWNRIYRLEPTLTEPALLFCETNGWPAGIHYNQRDHILAIPCYYQNTLQLAPDIFKIDSDADGLVDAYDNCPNFANPGQEDLDLDNIGNICDNCPDSYNPAQEDINGNGIGDECEAPEMWYVRADGLGDAPTLQAAIDSTTHGDTIVVADGLYSGSGNRALEFGGRTGMVIYSESGPEFTIIDCEGSASEPRRGMTVAGDMDSTFVIDGFTIRGGHGPVFNGASGGGGILFDGASPRVNNCVFTGNSAMMGGAMYVYDAAPRITNCTFADNSGSYGAAVFAFNHSSPELQNSILAFNTGSQPVVCMELSSVGASCCDVYGNTAGDWVGCLAGQEAINGNFSADPGFCDQIVGVFGLLVTSPCASANNDCGVLIGALDVACTCDCGVSGDMDCDGAVNPIDVVYLVNFVYLSQDALCTPPFCPFPIGDLDCNNQVNPVDVVYLTNAVYKAQNALCEGCAP